MPCLDDAGGALEGRYLMLVEGRSGERAGTQDREEKRLGWTQ
jgi:hypothetical protein